MRTLLLVLILSATAAPPSFDVASVKVNPNGSKGGERGGRSKIEYSPVSVTMTNVTLLSCVEWAYQVRDYQVLGAPAWFPEEGFDIAAKTSAEVPLNDLRLMMQTLLEERFGLAVKTSTRELPLYELVVAKGGSKLGPAAGEGEPTMTPGEGALIFRHFPMDEFAARLGTRPLKLDRPVIDATGLRGAYDFRLRFGADMIDLKKNLENMDRGDPASPLLQTIIQEQLGLKLESRKGPVSMLIVEHANRVPTGN
jgi:uncharacterized protein (TIGR03435 family)